MLLEVLDYNMEDLSYKRDLRLQDKKVFNQEIKRNQIWSLNIKVLEHITRTKAKR